MHRCGRKCLTVIFRINWKTRERSHSMSSRLNIQSKWFSWPENFLSFSFRFDFYLLFIIFNKRMILSVECAICNDEHTHGTGLWFCLFHSLNALSLIKSKIPTAPEYELQCAAADCRSIVSVYVCVCNVCDEKRTKIKQFRIWISHSQFCILQSQSLSHRFMF